MTIWRRRSGSAVGVGVWLQRPVDMVRNATFRWDVSFCAATGSVLPNPAADGAYRTGRPVLMDRFHERT